MPFSATILGTILLYTWVLQPRGNPVVIPGAVVISVTVWNAIKSGERGWSPGTFAAALRAATLFTVPAVLVVLGAGAMLGTLHDRGSFLRNLAILVVWGGAQQWVLQTVVLREAQRLTTPRKAVLIAAGLFALAHVPNPVLMVLTFLGALAWCAIYTRYPNVLPLGVSHALCTLALTYAFDDDITGRLRIGYAYLTIDR